jgi:membrane peptidoglycan carboxypeptidase
MALLATFVAASLVTGALAAGLFIPAVGATGVVTRSGVDYFNNLPADLSTPPLAEQSTMYAADGRTVIARFFDENRVNVPLAKIAPVMRQAIIAIEDSRFYQHGGVDAKGVVRAALNNSMNGEVQGASTLTQQYVKNYNVEKALAAGDPAAAKSAVSQSYSRKLQEIRTSVALEKKLSKDEILEGYLNIALFGNNTWGVEAAASYYFDTSATKLTLVQAATLAGLVQSPTTYNPFEHPDRALARRNDVLGRMLTLKMIDQKQYDTSRKAKLSTRRNPSRNGCITAQNAAFFCDYVINMMRTNPSYAFLGKTGAERITSIKRGGYSIVTSLDPKTQQQAHNTVVKHVPITDPSRVAAVAVTVQPGTGRVLALAQNRIYDPGAGRGKTQLNYGVDKTVGGSVGFATGSTFKPFTLATYLNKGDTSLNDVVDASQTVRPMGDFKACGQRLGGTEPYTFGNAGDGKGSGSMTVQEATFNSVNTAYVDIESRVDMCNLVTTANKLGVHLASPPGDRCGPRSGDGISINDKAEPLQLPWCQPSLTLGAKSISPMTMAAAYAAFSANGKFCEPRPVVSIRDRSGKNLPVPAEKCSQALDPEVARGVVYVMKKVLTQGTAANRGIGVPAGAKTGTSDESGNTWLVGYTKSLSTAVWVADPNTYPSDYPGRLGSGQRPLHNIRINGKSYGVVYGSTIAGAIWQDYMKQAIKGRNNGDWEDPPVSMLKGSGIRVPNVIGQPFDQAAAALTGAGFQVKMDGMVPGPGPAGTVARTSPSPGGLVAHGGTVKVYLSDGTQGGDGRGGDDGRGGGGGGGGGGRIPFPLPPFPR